MNSGYYISHTIPFFNSSLSLLSHCFESVHRLHSWSCRKARAALYLHMYFHPCIEIHPMLYSWRSEHCNLCQFKMHIFDIVHRLCMVFMCTKRFVVFSFWHTWPVTIWNGVVNWARCSKRTEHDRSHLFISTEGYGTLFLREGLELCISCATFQERFLLQIFPFYCLRDLGRTWWPKLLTRTSWNESLYRFTSSIMHVSCVMRFKFRWHQLSDHSPYRFIHYCRKFKISIKPLFCKNLCCPNLKFRNFKDFRIPFFKTDHENHLKIRVPVYIIFLFSCLLLADPNTFLDLEQSAS